MKYSINIDQINSLAWDLNLSEAAVFTYLFHVPTWADPILIDGQTFYFAARQKTCQDVPLISDKPDTIYRIYKSLHEKGVISYLKWMGRDCMRITEKGKGWNSEKNPSSAIELGKKSESTRKIFRKDSENFPTYNSTIDNHTILLEENNVEKEFSTVLIESDEELVMEIHHVPDYFDTEQKTPTPQVAPTPRPKAKKENPADLQIVTDVVNYLNEKTKQAFKPTTKETIQFIRSRASLDKWEMEDFKLVIDFKTSQWLDDEKMRQYLTPSTLFRAANAEKYLLAAKDWKERPVKMKPGIVPLFRQENYANVDKSKFKF